MSSLITLNNQLHKNVCVDAQEVELQGGQLHMVPVVLSEFLKLAINFPIVFTKNKETGRFSCVALFGFQPGENLFIKANQWDALYVPLQIKRQPFFLGNASDNHNEFFICIDTSHKSLGKNTGEPIFDANGNDTAYMESIKAILAELAQGEPLMEDFIQTLLQMKLLQSMHLEITLKNNESIRSEGLYTINEDNLKTLAEDNVFELHQNNYLSSIYTMITSLGHIYGMVDRKNKLLSGA
ncbi:MAG: SapC family protein [Cellvibrio sp.]